MPDFFAMFNTLDENLRTPIYLFAIAVLALLADLIMRRIILRNLKKLVDRTSTKWDDILMEQGVFKRLARYAPAILLYFLLPLALPPQAEGILEIFRRLILAYMIGVSILFLSSLLHGITAIYQTYDFSKSRPIKGFMQVLHILVYVGGIVLIATTIMGVSPLGILSGIGALSAVIMLIFRDSILGLIASIQLSVNKQVRIGDWIEAPQFGADGDVIDITLQSVMVQNWDKTIVTLPIYALTASSFKNWRGMSESGGRRIKRALYIDMNSICFLDDDDLHGLEQVPLISGYLKQKREELAGHDSSDGGIPRRLTNIGTFRAYIAAYLKSHQFIHDSMTLIVRQLPPGPEGLPIEIYGFSKDQNWAAYEGIQADIFDHLLSILPEFLLSIYQHPGSHDIRMLSRSLKSRKNI